MTTQSNNLPNLPNSSNSSQPSPKPKSLSNDLRKLLSDERFYDVSLKCSDNVILNACKNILACRSEVFNDYIFDKSKKNANQQRQQLEFDKINSIAMKLILEYLYTSKNEKEILSVEKIVEVYYAAIFFKLDDLQNDVIEYTMKILREGDGKKFYETEELNELAKKLLSEFIEKFSLEVDNEMSKLLVDWVAKIQLFPEKADNDSLSLMGLQYLLDKTRNTENQFATYELTLVEYTLNKTKNIILEENVGTKDPYDMNYDSKVLERIKDRIAPLLNYINLKIIDPDDVMGKIESLKLFPAEMITDAFRYRLGKKHESFQPMRGRLTFRWNTKKNKDGKDGNDKIRITNNGFTVEIDSNQKEYKSIMGDLIIKGNGHHKWDILIENLNDTIYFGICGINEEFRKPGDKGYEGGWALGSDGYVYNKKNWKWNNSKFTVGDVVHITVDMTAKHCLFGVNNVTFYEAIGHAFPDKLYPFVSLNKGGKVHIK
ncbi:hypothetical protein RclHR1_10460008 [Rhizophagus clarus]|uniref:BTB domain-containing protein n=1 Tax=Rhizophagus clarus TaxID=94130 RepID=A0A2Z6QG43_9GLOM|nr:hypothetical protein RclHR1_10460008 [Rhizophagus clarus]GES78612.1 hypothetical protein GLOIN_2v1837458 [Rhizophagus clarus]